MTPSPCSLGKGRLFGSSRGAQIAYSHGAVGGSDPLSTDNVEFQIMLSIIKEGLQTEASLSPPETTTVGGGGPFSVTEATIAGNCYPPHATISSIMSLLVVNHSFPSEIAWFRFRFRLLD
ncbi:hypothetical protein L1887_32350 [Cichorium endivia]|nr:hypothetical protein L1887_32350 [Cichorium endivia]